MSAWRDQLQRASFRGVPFHVKSSDTEEGRRGVLFEYPQRDDPFVEDLGRKAGEFTLEAFILGDDYFKARDALRDALKQPGAGELVHPTLGRMQVALVATYRFVESLVDEGGMARFTLRFTEAGENQQPSDRTDTAAVVDAAADTAVEECCANFEEEFDVTDLPEFVTADALALLSEATQAIDAVRAGLLPDLSVVGDLVKGISTFSSALSNLILTPLALAGQAFQLFYGLRGALLRPFDALRALGKLFGYNSNRPRAAQTTASRTAQARNRTAIESLMRRAAVIEASRAAARIDFAAAGVSYQQATTMREQLADALEEEAATAPVAVFNALMDLRAAVVRDITARGADLPRLSAISMPATLPALVVAYRAFGDTSREAEIVARNPIIIRHPGFVPGGVSLEVLA